MPGARVVRHDILPLEMPPFTRVKHRVGVRFHGEAPLTGDDEPAASTPTPEFSH